MKENTIKALRNTVLKELQGQYLTEFVVSLVGSKEIAEEQRLKIKRQLSQVTLHEFLTNNDNCVDIYLNGFECCPASTETEASGHDKFTKEGKEKFKKFLTAIVVDPFEHLCNRGIIHILVGGTEETNREYINQDEDLVCDEFGQFLYAMAGHCSYKLYEKWFKEYDYGK
jgi:hypothetical protein